MPCTSAASAFLGERGFDYLLVLQLGGGAAVAGGGADQEPAFVLLRLARTSSSRCGRPPNWPAWAIVNVKAIEPTDQPDRWLMTTPL
jgi:hypothetical protein